jgi:hypothetical protein
MNCRLLAETTRTMLWPVLVLKAGFLVGCTACLEWQSVSGEVKLAANVFEQALYSGYGKMPAMLISGW